MENTCEDCAIGASEMSEKDIQVECNKLLRSLGIQFIHDEKGRGSNKRHRKSQPDLLFWYANKSVAVELKQRGQEPRTDQIEWGQKFSVYQNNVWRVLHSAEELSELLIELKHGKL